MATVVVKDLNADKLRRLSAAADKDAADCSRRGDLEGDFYCRGLRDAYAAAAAFWSGDPQP